MNSMVAAGWLHSHIFTVGKGHHLVWSEAGIQRSILMKHISESHRLNTDDRAPVLFDILCKGERLPADTSICEVEELISEYWRECVGELGLHGDEDGLLALVRIVIGWAPGEDRLRLS